MSGFIAELERRVIAIQNEIAFLEELRWRSTVEDSGSTSSATSSATSTPPWTARFSRSR